MPIAPVLAIVSGICIHILVFRLGEWDVLSPYIVVTYLFSILVAAYAPNSPLSDWELAALVGWHLAGLYTSMLVYRALFHRLYHYPGPFLSRLTNFYITALSAKKLHLFEEVRRLHVLYGDYVRIGPSELSIADPEAVRAIYGTQSPVSKGPWYTLLEPRTPLFMARDKQEHARRRKGYDPRITKAIDQLLPILERHVGQPIDMARWFALFVFDVMEDLAFNKSSNMLRDGKEAYVFKTIRTDMYNIAYFAHLPWLLPLFKRIPLLNSNYLTFWNWIQAQINERIENEPKLPDVFSWILEAYLQGPKTKQDRYNLHGDAQLIVIAGSDSTAAALTHIFFHLALDESLTQALQKEFDAAPNRTHERLVGLPLLDAVINEVLRLHPPVPSGTQRVTPPEGLRIGQVHIPGNVIVQVPSYTVFRDRRAFVQPDDFIPDRWTTRPELILDKSVFIPFNLGSYACIGKRLALIEIRRVVAEILWRYDVHVAPGFSPESFLDGRQDTFTLVSGSLPLIFTKRARDVL
ncbi:cytochrome P450 monooxygenase-like protein [Thozetella sp. PMI_491]|nr:cytochrome P450 monooxygenase-like protein [Thozetella sp. PMI_491]